MKPLFRYCIAAFFLTGLSQASASEFPKSVTLKVGYDAGTGHDMIGRLIADALVRFLPAGTQISVENAPGASGLVLARRMIDVETKDGSTIGLVPLGLVRNSMIDAKTFSADPRKLKWIGAFSSPDMLCVARNEGADTVDLAKNSAVKVATGSKGGYTYYFATALRAMRFKDLTVISGFKNEVEMIASIDRKETDIICGLTLQSFQRSGAEDRMKVIATVLPSETFQKSGIPYLFSGISELDRKALDVIAFPAHYFYPFVVPPDVPESIVEQYRTAFAAMSKDPKFLATLDKNKFEPTFISGATLQDEVEKILSSDAAAVERARELAN